MTTNREMLEFAAKAAGIEITAIVDKGIPRIFRGGYWNPLTSSADCTAMCAKLLISTNNAWNQQVICSGQGMGFKAGIEDHDNDREAAWRYAATMVAAKIGGMK